MTTFSPGLRIVALGLGAAVGYGVIHDQITARVCIEYFTVGHPRLIESESPTILGLLWGVVATWWVGLPLGVLLALAARAGRWPPLEARDLLPGMMVLLLIMGISAGAAGFLGYELAVAKQVLLPLDLANRIPPEHHAPFMGDWWAHGASYLVGILGGALLCLMTLLRRWRRARRLHLQVP